MNARRLLSIAVLGMAALAIPLNVAHAQEDLAAAKSAGLIGERPDGLVGYVADAVPADVRSLVERINAERKRRYEEIANSTGQSLAEVQAVAGDRLVSATPNGLYVMNAAGRWIKK